MKNLKKTLSFVLVLAMVLGMVSTAFAGTFTDDATITNKEAVAVLSAIEVIRGYEDGSFNATKTVTRGQAAAFICRLVLGSKEADTLVAIEAPFSDVPETNQFAGYIAYCVAQGIVDGYSDGTFRPSASVTTIQFGKMILTALGYNSSFEGYTGTGWKTNVYNDLKDAELLASVKSGVNAGLTREETAQVCLNALTVARKDFVGGNAGTVITVGDAKIEMAGSTGYYDDDKACLLDAVYNNAKENGKLTFSESTADALGRPIEKVWTLVVTTDEGTTTTKPYEKVATPVYTSADQYVLQTAVYKALGLTTTAGVEVAGYLNGNQVSSTTSNYIAATGSSYAYYFGPGTTTEIYEVDDNEYKILSYLKVAVQADADYSKTSEGAIVAGEFLETEDFAAVDSETEKGDWFIVTYNNGSIASVEDATLVTGAYTGYVKDSSVTVGGNKFSYAYTERYTISATKRSTGLIDAAVATLANKTVITLVTDSNGYAYCVTDNPTEETSTVCLYLAKVGYDTTTSRYGSSATTYYGKGYLADLTEFEDYKLETAYEEGLWYSYTDADGDGLYELAEDDGIAAYEVTDAINANITFASGVAIKASTSTKFVVKTKNSSNADVYTSYTGYKSLPQLAANSGEEIAIAVLYTEANSGIAASVFVDATGAETVEDNATTESYMVGYSTAASSTGVKDGVSYSTYNYCFDLSGNKVALTFNTNKCTAPASGTIIKNVEYDTNGFVIGYDTKDVTYSLGRGDVVANDIDAYINVLDANTLVISGDDYEVADDCVVYVFSNGALKTVTLTDLDDVIEDYTWTYHWNSYAAAKAYITKNTSGVVTAIYLWGAYDNTYAKGTEAETLYIYGNKGVYQNSKDASGNKFTSTYYAYKGKTRYTVRFAEGVTVPTEKGYFDVTYDANGYVATCEAHVE